MNRSQAARLDAPLKEEVTEEPLRPRQARRALPVERGHSGSVVAERAVRERNPPCSAAPILAALSSGLKPVMPILGLLSFASLACAQSEPVQATQGVGEVIVDTLPWTGAVAREVAIPSRSSSGRSIMKDLDVRRLALRSL